MSGTKRVEEVRHLLKLADDLRERAKEAEGAAEMVACGLDVMAGTYRIPRGLYPLMAEALRAKAAELIAEAQHFEDQV